MGGRRRVGGTLGIAAGLLTVSAFVLASPLAASAAYSAYFDGHDIGGAWKSSYDRSRSNKADAEGSAYTVQVKTNGVTSTGAGEVVQSYGLTTAWEYCRVSGPTTISVGVKCYVNLG
jgi:hypothetical protein